MSLFINIIYLVLLFVGHFTILKAIAYCVALNDQKLIATALQGHFVSLGTNLIGARIVESILQLYPSKLTATLKAEFYGKVCPIYIICSDFYFNSSSHASTQINALK